MVGSVKILYDHNIVFWKYGLISLPRRSQGFVVGRNGICKTKFPNNLGHKLAVFLKTTCYHFENKTIFPQNLPFQKCAGVMRSLHFAPLPPALAEPSRSQGLGLLSNRSWGGGGSGGPGLHLQATGG